MNSGLTSHQQRGHTETGPRFKVSSERPEKRGIDLATPGLVVQRVIHYTTAAPKNVNIVSVLGSKFENRIELEVKPCIFVRFSIIFSHAIHSVSHLKTKQTDFCSIFNEFSYAIFYVLM